MAKRDNYNEYMNTYMKERYKQRRIKAIEHMGGKCTICGAIEKLVFHHTDPSAKVNTIARFSSVSEERFWEEITKCILVCAECHKNIHAPKHGTLSIRGCKCQPCVEARRTYKREWKRKRKMSA